MNFEMTAKESTMFGIYLPYSVYELMPYGYMLFGATSLVGVEGAIPKLCGAILIGVGIAVVRIRHQYRRDRYAHPLGRPHAH